MHPIQLRPEVILALALVAAALAIGVLGRLMAGAAKIRLWYWSHSLLGLSVCAFGVADLMLQRRLPMSEAFVVIEKVGIQSTGRGSELTNLIVRLPSGEAANLKASGRNAFFRPAQLMKARYQQSTGLLDWARFYSSSGIEEAQYRSHIWIVPYCLFALGLLLMASARKRFATTQRRSSLVNED